MFRWRATSSHIFYYLPFWSGGHMLWRSVQINPCRCPSREHSFQVCFHVIFNIFRKKNTLKLNTLLSYSSIILAVTTMAPSWISVKHENTHILMSNPVRYHVLFLFLSMLKFSHDIPPWRSCWFPISTWTC